MLGLNPGSGWAVVVVVVHITLAAILWNACVVRADLHQQLLSRDVHGTAPVQHFLRRLSI
jgi:hypothetical protein